MDRQNRKHIAGTPQAPFTDEAQRRREVAVAHFYLIARVDRLPAAQVADVDFRAAAKLGVWWQLARAMASRGEVASIEDYIIGSDWRDHAQLIDDLTNAAGKYVPSLIPKFEREMIAASAMRAMLREFQLLDREARVGSLTTADAANRLDRLTVRLRTLDQTGWRRMAVVAREVATRFAAARAGDIELTLSMSTRKLQAALGGWVFGRLHMIMAVTSGHKTTLLRQELEHIAVNGNCAAYITMEDSEADIVARSMAARSKGRFTVRDLMTGQGNWGAPEMIVRVEEEIRKTNPPLLIRQAALTLGQCVAMIHSAKNQGAKALGVDFFQLLRPDDSRMGSTEFWHLAATEIQRAAMETNMAIILCVQPTQSATKSSHGTNYVTGTGDARGGSAIGQAAFGLLSLSFRYDDDGKRIPDEIYITVQKWKHAQTGIPHKFRLDAAHDTISDWDE